MDEDTFIASLEDLTGKVAIVTGGAAGIGLDITTYLARQGATVYVASRNPEKSSKGIASAQEKLRAEGGKSAERAANIRFHQLDLSSMAGAVESAEAFLHNEQRLDILMCNAGISMMTMKELSPDGYDRQFATNHLGHFAFEETLRGLIEETAAKHGDVRIVTVSSTGYKAASKLDYKALTTVVEGDGERMWHVPGAFKRYAGSKLSNMYFVFELDRKLREKGLKTIYANTAHPGADATTGLGAITDQTSVGPWFQNGLRSVLSKFSMSTIDCAKTPTYLAAAAEIREKDVHGQYWAPNFSMSMRYKSCAKESLSALAMDVGEQKKLWDVSEKELLKAKGKKGQS